VRIVLDRTRYRGRAIDLADKGLSAAVVRRAIERPSAVAVSHATDPSTDGELATGGRRLRIDCTAPGTVHEQVGRIGPGIGLDLRTALAAAARSRGETAPQRDQLRRAREQLDALAVPDAEPRKARRDLATAGADERRLRERVAELRGRVQTLRETAPESQRLADAERELAATAADLSEAETDRLAAEQRLARAERTARRARDARERRLRLQDRVQNLRRRARAALARRAYPAFVDALGALPGVDPSAVLSEATAPGSDPQELPDVTGETTAAALAVARIADVDAPVVFAGERFETAAAASAWLDAPVVRVDVQTG
jgi:hypothetical protein